ncbi:MAG: hypothetical protein ACK5ZV_01585 [bacterium]
MMDGPENDRGKQASDGCDEVGWFGRQGPLDGPGHWRGAKSRGWAARREDAEVLGIVKGAGQVG